MCVAPGAVGVRLTERLELCDIINYRLDCTSRSRVSYIVHRHRHCITIVPILSSPPNLLGTEALYQALSTTPTTHTQSPTYRCHHTSAVCR